MQKNRGAKAFNGKVCPIDKRGIGIMIFQAGEEARDPFFLWEWAVGESTLFDKKLSFVR